MPREVVSTGSITTSRGPWLHGELPLNRFALENHAIIGFGCESGASVIGTARQYGG